MIDALTAFRNCISDQKCKGCEYGCGGHERKVTVPLTLCLALCREIREKSNVVDLQRSRSYQGVFLHGKCPNCNREVNNSNNPNYCGYCGKPVKWW